MPLPFAKPDRLLPGVALCAAVTALALCGQHLQVALFGRAWFDTVVLAILIGAAFRIAWTPSERMQAGIDFSAKYLLEIAVVLLGASIGAGSLAAAGPLLLGGIALVVVCAIGASYAVSRLIGLTPHLAILVACGNSICGNSAIAATAPVIGAKGDDVAATIAFTALIGIPMVLLLPLAMPLLGLNESQYGMLAGLTVYAVPQVLAATAPVSPLALQTGTLVKLVRVMMLGPVVMALALIAGRKNEQSLRLSAMIPWFVVGFAVMMTLRGLDMIPQPALAPMITASSLLTALSMAALGLSVDLRAATSSGGAVIGAALASLCMLGLFSLTLISLLPA